MGQGLNPSPPSLIMLEIFPRQLVSMSEPERTQRDSAEQHGCGPWGVSMSELEQTQRDSAQQHCCGVWARRSRSGPKETQLSNMAVGCGHVGAGADPKRHSSPTRLWVVSMLEPERTHRNSAPQHSCGVWTNMSEPEQTQRQKTVCTTQKNFQVLKTEYSNQSFSEDYGITCYTM